MNKIGTPTTDRIVVKPIENESISPGGIFIPDKAREKPQKGIVIAVGPGRYIDCGNFIKPAIKEGQTVLYGKYTGVEIEVEKEKHLIMKENDILMILN